MNHIARLTSDRGESVPIIALLVLALALVPQPASTDCSLTSTGKIPLNDLGPGIYKGAQGGLYPNGADTRPATHEAAGYEIARNQIKPLDASGDPDPENGKVVLISIGMSNTTQEFATGGRGAFQPQANADRSKNPHVVIVDCAQGGHAGNEWKDPANDAWETANLRLASAGVSPLQVQVAWVKLAERTRDLPTLTFPAHAEWHQGNLEEAVRILKGNYPNVRIAFLSSRTRSYEDRLTTLNPEPIAYEENFAVKWLIEDQTRGKPELNFSPGRGEVTAPFLAWGPYLWIDGETPRSDGMTWLCTDVRQTDYTHPSADGVTKVGGQLLAFFKSDPLCTPWFLRSEVVGQAPSIAIESDTTSGPAPLVLSLGVAGTDPDGTLVDFAWCFDDGTYSPDERPVKVFPVPGVYRLHLTASDSDGNPVTDSLEITVTGPAQQIPGTHLMAR